MCVSKMTDFLSEYGGYSSNYKYMGPYRYVGVALKEKAINFAQGNFCICIFNDNYEE